MSCKRDNDIMVFLSFIEKQSIVFKENGGKENDYNNQLGHQFAAQGSCIIVGRCAENA